MLRTVIAGLVFGFSVSAMAQMSPVGVWNSVDDKTKELKSEIVITENAGVLSGKISKLLRKDAKQDDVCRECTDDRKDKPLIGLEIIRGAKKADGKDVWEDGKILDPENGKTYALRMTPIENGSKLEVRGSIAFFGRTQTWVRAK
ncbi:DUF2147 domain-containing protein [Rhodoferax sp. AJA081-3]|jgi:uncharacterized protein (DUF2147 family)|uniref:DUF2147 domain-containing protein n=1 Tax=Rhodoferax sp. AJA081-3 TaxID=2752316 RepID=UPI001AE0780E|nr:DUF2147 domain-containing protein [Rhodoferax sp. AJA081-3]QTN27208.1 DUF2147 domain-containing protein [Rhodoferax sp. AJA081-3]